MLFWIQRTSRVFIIFKGKLKQYTCTFFRNHEKSKTSEVTMHGVEQTPQFLTVIPKNKSRRTKIIMLL